MLSRRAILAQYRDRWAIEITLRDSYAFDGLGRDQCRKVERIVGVNSLRLMLAAARTLWFLARASTNLLEAGYSWEDIARFREKEAV